MKSSITKLIYCALATCALILFVCERTTQAQATRHKTTQQKTTATSSSSTRYVCPMHPEVTSNRRGRCPKCGMNLKAESSAPQPPSTAASANTTGAATRANETLSTKPRIPDTTVLDQNGRRLNFYTDLVKGKTVAINFIFTTCQGVCPPLTATFRRVQQALGERVGRDIQLISISVDPATDVPERLKAFSQKFKAGPGWTFVTGSKQEIDSLLDSLGGYAPNKNDHTPMILIGNEAAGFWTRTYGLSPATQIVNIVNDAASKSPAATASTAESNVKTATAEKQSSTDDAQAMREASAKYFPNLVLLTQDNKPVRFYDDLLKGKVVLINFLFTTCKGVCSPMTANLAKVQKYLGERVGREVVMISVSVDPLTDTPAVLKKYADSFKTQPGWYFLTGEKKNVDWVLYKLGGYVEDREKHTSVLIIGNEATGEWMKVHAMANPSEIASAVTKLLAGKKETD
ncbi:MAG TPA: SCO family protein [Pyrinomonadaceae bacterium]|jgi:cytochrome oxidase Cu insertion factor (SCO1/SenC/PrrC family)